jgi:hypothetical protein
MRKVLLTESQLIELIESEVVKINKSDLKNDWDAERIVNLKGRNKIMVTKTKSGNFKEIDRKSGQSKVYYISKKDLGVVNNLVDQINELKSKLDSILK